MQHNCLKCSQSYTSEEQDAYLCRSCISNKAKIAATLDKEFVARPTAETTLERYENAKKVKGGFPKASDVL